MVRPTLLLSGAPSLVPMICMRSLAYRLTYSVGSEGGAVRGAALSRFDDTSLRKERTEYTVSEFYQAGRIDAPHQALRSGFLIAAGTIDLACGKQARDPRDL